MLGLVGAFLSSTGVDRLTDSLGKCSTQDRLCWGLLFPATVSWLVVRVQPVSRTKMTQCHKVRGTVLTQCRKVIGGRPVCPPNSTSSQQVTKVHPTRKAESEAPEEGTKWVGRLAGSTGS